MSADKKQYLFTLCIDMHNTVIPKYRVDSFIENKLYGVDIDKEYIDAADEFIGVSLMSEMLNVKMMRARALLSTNTYDHLLAINTNFEMTREMLSEYITTMTPEELDKFITKCIA